MTGQGDDTHIVVFYWANGPHALPLWVVYLVFVDEEWRRGDATGTSSYNTNYAYEIFTEMATCFVLPGFRDPSSAPRALSEQHFLRTLPCVVRLLRDCY